MQQQQRKEPKIWDWAKRKLSPLQFKLNQHLLINSIQTWSWAEQGRSKWGSLCPRSSQTSTNVKMLLLCILFWFCLFGGGVFELFLLVQGASSSFAVNPGSAWVIRRCRGKNQGWLQTRIVPYILNYCSISESGLETIILAVRRKEDKYNCSSGTFQSPDYRKQEWVQGPGFTNPCLVFLHVSF